MLIEREDAAALLRHCCVGQTRDDESCSHTLATSPHPTIRDAGALSGEGVLAPSVQRDIAGVTGSPLRGGHAVRILSDGTDSFGAMLDLVRTAREDIRFENFIFRADAVGRVFASELRARDDEGVRVRVVHDPVGALMAGKRPIDLLFRGSTVEVRLFNLEFPTLESRRLGRDHRKLVLADGSRMIAGGICLADPWVGNCVRHCTWRDSAVLVEGAAAADAAAAFDEVWGLSRRLFGRPSRSELRPPRPQRHEGDIPVRVIADLGRSRPTARVIERSIEAARREVLITNPYFIPPDSIGHALAGAARRGVEVAVLVPGRNNHAVAGLSGEERAGALLRHGVHIYRWGGTMIHAKSIVVDGEWTLIGSSNLDHLSLNKNAELNVEIHGTAVGRTMAELFREDCRQSTRVTRDDWEGRSRARRIATRAALRLRRWQ